MNASASLTKGSVHGNGGVAAFMLQGLAVLNGQGGLMLELVATARDVHYFNLSCKRGTWSC